MPSERERSSERGGGVRLPGRSGGAWLVVAAGAGAATMVVELAAVRLLAPWFGTSQTVWTNVIGVVLLALSAGYLLGARLSGGARPERALGIALACAAAGAALLPFAAAPVARLFLPPGLALDEVAGLLRWGSLATALVLFLPPALLLGCVSPLCAEILDRTRPSSAGSAGGRVLAVSTLGSLAGTFATSWVLLPACGLTRTFLLAGACLALLACGVLLRTRAGARAFLALCPLAGFAAGDARRPELAEGTTLLAARESAYQSVRVTRLGAPGADEERQLQVNEAFDSFQSVWRPRAGPIGTGSYYDVFALPAWWASGERTSWSVCVLGLGGGTAWRVLDGTLPAGRRLVTLGVEIDPVVVALARQWMDLASGPAREVLDGWDARTALAHTERRFDQIIVDAYANQMEIPAHLCTREFFALVREHLEPGGFVTINVGAFDLADPVLERVAAAVCAGFGSSAEALRVPFSRNVVVCARAGADLPAADAPEWVPEHAGLVALARRLALPVARRRFEPGARDVPTDDRSDMELRQIDSLERAAALRNEAPAARIVNAESAVAIPEKDTLETRRVLAEHFARSEFAAALELARSLAPGRERARAEVLAAYQAGDMHGALRSGVAALGTYTDDAALAWSVGDVALNLGAVAAARLATDALGRALEHGQVATAERAEWVAAHATREAATRALEARAATSRSALSRARAAAAVLLGACTAALVLFGLAAARVSSPGEQ